MNRKSNSSCKRQRAMTLVEVIGGLALLATLLVSMLLAKGRYMHQAAIADRRLSAVHAADTLLTAWHQDPSTLVRAGTGRVEGDAGLVWRTRMIADPAINALQAQVIRLEIVDSQSTEAINPVLSSVEFVVDSSTPKPVRIKLQSSSKKHPNPQPIGTR